MKIGAKISAMGVTLVAVSAAALLGVVLIQKQALRQKLTDGIRRQGISEATKIAQNTYLMCVGNEARNQRQLARTLQAARNSLAGKGGIRLDSESVEWQAVNQLTKVSTRITLPKMLLGANWLGQILTTNQLAPIVDEISTATGDFCTIFQRMNDAGDMLRICTSVTLDNGKRALGTFIPAKDAEGSDNLIIRSVLQGKTYAGRAWVVNQWHAAAYEPIWDGNNKQVIGMLYVGVGLKDINKEMHDSITQMVVGKTGYVYVLGAKGDYRGRYIISKKGERDGELIWDVKDSDGHPFVQSIVAKALKTKHGSVEIERYGWKNSGEATARTKFAACTYFEPWDWVIGAGTYDDDFNEMVLETESALQRMLHWVALASSIVALLSLAISFGISRSIAKPIIHTIQALTTSSSQTASSCKQMSTCSQTLAEGASEQAASLEETSSSLEEMHSMTQRNAENAQTAKETAVQARQAADTGAEQMKILLTAMDDIKTASDDITKILKNIDEIAFQTNILALNAAVEAARAGDSGAGFAVVADEVRTLAKRCADAARETAVKIEDSVRKSQQGTHYCAGVARSFDAIQTKVRLLDQLVAQIASASQEQSQGISQVNIAVSQMDKVTQSNAATAEESASAAEELNGQVESLREVVTSLQQLVGGAENPLSRHAVKPATQSVCASTGWAPQIRHSHQANQHKTARHVISRPIADN